MGNRNKKSKLRKIIINNETYFWNVSQYNCDGDGGCRFDIWKDKVNIFHGSNNNKIITPIIVKEKILELNQHSIIVISLDIEDFLNYKKENNLNGDGLETRRKFKINNKTYRCVTKVRDLHSIGVDEVIETKNAKKNKEYTNIIESIKVNLNYKSTWMII